MKKLACELDPNEYKSFSVGDIVISYPGAKEKGDYRLTINNNAPKHSDIVIEIYELTTPENLNSIIESLDDVFTNGTNALAGIFSKELILKLFWITLQEEINYPNPPYKGRKLPFQRFYEAALAKVDNTPISSVVARTNNHGGRVPRPIATNSHRVPSFYSWQINLKDNR